MADKKAQKTVDALRSDMIELKEAFWALRDGLLTQSAVSAAEQQSSGASRPLDDKAAHLATRTSEGEASGYINTAGHVVRADGNGAAMTYAWSTGDLPVDGVLNINVESAAKTLAAIGHKQRLAILLNLLSAPSSAADLVSSLNLGTTGAAYHHLNVLQTNGFVHQSQRGIYAISPDALPSLLSIVAGLGQSLQVTVEPVAVDEKKKKSKV